MFGDEALQARQGGLLNTRSSASCTIGRRDLGVGCDVCGVHNRRVESGLNAVVQKDRIEHGSVLRGASPKLTLETPRMVSTPGNSRLMSRIPSIVSLCRVDPFGIAGGEGEGQRVEDEIRRLHAVFADDDVRESCARYLEFAFAGCLRHADFDRWSGRPARRHASMARGTTRSRCAAGHFSMLMELMIARPGHVFEGGLDDVRLGGVDHHGRAPHDIERSLTTVGHLLGFVAAFGECDADIEHMRAGFSACSRATPRMPS